MHVFAKFQWRNVAPASPGCTMRRGRQNFEFKLFGCKNVHIVFPQKWNKMCTICQVIFARVLQNMLSRAQIISDPV